jgi:hypothetical protein
LFTTIQIFLHKNSKDTYLKVGQIQKKNKVCNEEEEDYNKSLSKFESMLKTNKVLFFDSEEFEEIILHYLDMGKAALEKKHLN